MYLDQPVAQPQQMKTKRSKATNSASTGASLTAMIDILWDWATGLLLDTGAAEIFLTRGAAEFGY